MAPVTNVTNKTPEAYLQGVKVFTVVMSDGETFVPPGFTKVLAAIPAYAADPATGNPIGCTISGNTITFQCTGASDVTTSVVVFGQH